MTWFLDGARSTDKDRLRLARDFKEDPRTERLLLALAKDPTLREKLSTTLRLQLGYYQSAKDAAAEVAAEQAAAAQP